LKPFGFRKYFDKYKIDTATVQDRPARYTDKRLDAKTSTDPLARKLIRGKTFEHILDKCIDRLIHVKPTASGLSMIDIEWITGYYMVHETRVVKYMLFLDDYEVAQALVHDECHRHAIQRVLEEEKHDMAHGDGNDDENDDEMSFDDEITSSSSSSGSSPRRFSHTNAHAISSRSQRQARSRELPNAKAVAGDTTHVVHPKLASLLDRLLIQANWNTTMAQKCMDKLNVMPPPCKRPRLFLQWLQSFKLPWKKKDLETVVQVRNISTDIYIYI
jgi:hypothetical protein